MAGLTWGSVATTGGQSFDPGGNGFSPTVLATTEVTTLAIDGEDCAWEVRRQKAWWPRPWMADDITSSVNLFVGTSGGSSGDALPIDVLYTFDATAGGSYTLQAFIDTIRIKRINPNSLLWTATPTGNADPDGIYAAVPMAGTPPAWWTHTPTDVVLETQRSGIDNHYGVYAACLFDLQNGCVYENSMRLTQRREASWIDPAANRYGHWGALNVGVASVTFNGTLRGRLNSCDLFSNGQSPPMRWGQITDGGSQIGITGELAWPVAVALPTDLEVSLRWFDSGYFIFYMYRYAVYVYDDSNQTPAILVTGTPTNDGGGMFHTTRDTVDLSSYTPTGGCTKVYAYVMLQVSHDGGTTWNDVVAHAPMFGPSSIFNIVNPKKAPIATPGWTCGVWSWIPGILGPPISVP